ncbi:hypothetical protein ACFL1M_04325, partial [Patescibacteria group bacterium]
MKKFLLSFLVLGLVISPVFALEESEDSSLVGNSDAGVVSSEDVPMPGGFSDWWLQNVTERFETFAARTDEKRIALEEKFASRREAQL